MRAVRSPVTGSPTIDALDIDGERTLQVRRESPTRVEVISRRAVAFVAMAALLVLAVGPGVATASDGRDHRNTESTFTKWAIATPPGPGILFNMAGVVGSDVGPGDFTGEVLSFDQVGNVATIHALYHFNGSRHSFTADVHVVQTGLHAVITGLVTDGWLNGNRVAAQYDQITCTHTNGVTNDVIVTDCFQGTLDILRGSKHED